MLWVLIFSISISEKGLKISTLPNGLFFINFIDFSSF